MINPKLQEHLDHSAPCTSQFDGFDRADTDYQAERDAANEELEAEMRAGEARTRGVVDDHLLEAIDRAYYRVSTGLNVYSCPALMGALDDTLPCFGPGTEHERLRVIQGVIEGYKQMIHARDGGKPIWWDGPPNWIASRLEALSYFRQLSEQRIKEAKR